MGSGHSVRAFFTALACGASQPFEERKGEREILPAILHFTARQGNWDKERLEGFRSQQEVHQNPF